VTVLSEKDQIEQGNTWQGEEDDLRSKYGEGLKTSIMIKAKAPKSSRGLETGCGLRMKWRRLNNILHRDIGYWRSSLPSSRRVGAGGQPQGRLESELPGGEDGAAHLAITAPTATRSSGKPGGLLEIAEEPRNTFRRTSETLRLFFRNHRLDRRCHRPVGREASARRPCSSR